MACCSEITYQKSGMCKFHAKIGACQRLNKNGIYSKALIHTVQI